MLVRPPACARVLHPERRRPPRAHQRAHLARCLRLDLFDHGDLVAWLQALHGGKVLSPQSYAEMTSPSRLEDGTPLSYGLGMQLNTDVRGRREIRATANAGMQEKAREFREKGSEIYLPEIPNP